MDEIDLVTFLKQKVSSSKECVGVQNCTKASGGDDVNNKSTYASIVKKNISE